MSEAAKRIIPIDFEVFERAVDELSLYHNLIKDVYDDAVKNKMHDYVVEDLLYQKEMLENIILGLRKSVINGTISGRIDSEEIH